MKTQLNRELIEGLSESSNEIFYTNVNDFVERLIYTVVDDISKKSPFVRSDKCVLLPVNEIYLGAFTQLSEYDYFLGIENTQIELNSKNRKNLWKNLWREFRASWRIGRKKYKRRKRKAELEQPELKIKEIDRYRITDFRHDVMMRSIYYLSPTSLVSEYTRCISMMGVDDFGTDVKVNIYVCIYNFNKKQFKLYNEIKNKYIVVDFGKRFENLDFKIQECGDMFLIMIKIFNALYSKAYNRVPNQILIESLLFNCPKSLFIQGDVYKSFVNIANYIRFTNPQSFLSICNGEKNIFEEFLITGRNSQVEFGKLINMLDRYKY